MKSFLFALTLVVATNAAYKKWFTNLTDESLFSYVDSRLLYKQDESGLVMDWDLGRSEYDGISDVASLNHFMISMFSNKTYVLWEESAVIPNIGRVHLFGIVEPTPPTAPTTKETEENIITSEMYDWNTMFFDTVVVSSPFLSPQELDHLLSYSDGTSYVRGDPTIIPWTSTVSTALTEKIGTTHKHEYMMHVRELPQVATDFHSNWNHVDDKKLYQVLSNVVWLSTTYRGQTMNEDNKRVNIVLRYRSSGFFVEDDEIITARHSVADHICYSLSLGQGELFMAGERAEECDEHLVTVPIEKGLSLISTYTTSYDPHLTSAIGFVDVSNTPGVYEISSMEISRTLDITTVTTMGGDHESFEENPFIPWNCEAGDEVFVIGHPRDFTQDAVTSDGSIPKEDARRMFYDGSLTITVGKIIHAECHIKGHSIFLFDGLSWYGFSGGPIVLQSDPYKLCGTISFAQTDEISGFMKYHNGVCSSHLPAFKDAGLVTKDEL